MHEKSVNLCIYTIPEVPDLPGIPGTGHRGSNAHQRDRDKIFRDVREASIIWLNENIMFVIKKIEHFVEQTPREFAPIRADRITNTATNMLPPEFLSLFNRRPLCDNNDIALYYIPGLAYTDPLGTQASFHFLPSSTPTNAIQPTQHSIIMSDGAEGRILAHELGHALMLRSDGGPCSNFAFQMLRGPRGTPTERILVAGWGHDEPDPAMMTTNCGHHTDPNNLMNVPVFAGETAITPLQGRTARKSHLIKNFKPDFRVDFKSLIVHDVDDGAGDDELESNWIFKVWLLISGDPNNIRLIDEKPWHEEFLTAGTYHLGLSIPFSVESDYDVIRIEVYGFDRDEVDDDALPVLVRDYNYDNTWGNWGVGVMDGDPLAGPIDCRCAGNEHIHYSLQYEIVSLS